MVSQVSRGAVGAVQTCWAGVLWRVQAYMQVHTHTYRMRVYLSETLFRFERVTRCVW